MYDPDLIVTAVGNRIVKQRDADATATAGSMAADPRTAAVALRVHGW
jgi:hypothetical protein